MKPETYLFLEEKMKSARNGKNEGKDKIFFLFLTILKDNWPFKTIYCVNIIGKSVKLMTTTQRIRDWGSTVVRLHLHSKSSIYRLKVNCDYLQVLIINPTSTTKTFAKRGKISPK